MSIQYYKIFLLSWLLNIQRYYALSVCRLSTKKRDICLPHHDGAALYRRKICVIVPQCNCHAIIKFTPFSFMNKNHTYPIVPDYTLNLS